jgi:hypothetical protein
MEPTSSKVRIDPFIVIAATCACSPREQSMAQVLDVTDGVGAPVARRSLRMA